MQYTLVTAGPESLEHVLSLLRQNHLPTDGVAENFACFILAVSGNTVIGAVGLECHGDQALLRSLVVCPECRSRGVGEALVKACIQKAKDNRCRELYLLTTTAADYFTRFGFERLDRSLVSGRVLESGEFKHVCPCTATVMLKRLLTP
ncbi:MAG TPA: GNAT family N-acetyltransferase [Firmicutes bacterium]|nr:GNAT family N-acetyltransferase [Bacillota bacterium]